MGTKATIKKISNNLNVELSHANLEISLCGMYKYHAKKGGRSNSSSQSTLSRNTATNSNDLWNYINQIQVLSQLVPVHSYLQQ